MIAARDYKQQEEAYIKRAQENQLKSDISNLQFRCERARSDLDRKRYRSDPNDLEKAESAISVVEAWARNFQPAAVTEEGPRYDRDEFFAQGKHLQQIVNLVGANPWWRAKDAFELLRMSCWQMLRDLLQTVPEHHPVQWVSEANTTADILRLAESNAPFALAEWRAALVAAQEAIELCDRHVQSFRSSDEPISPGLSREFDAKRRVLEDIAEMVVTEEMRRRNQEARDLLEKGCYDAIANIEQADCDSESEGEIPDALALAERLVERNLAMEDIRSSLALAWGKFKQHPTKQNMTVKEELQWTRTCIESDKFYKQRILREFGAPGP